MRYGRQYLDIDGAFLVHLVPTIVETMGGFFGELKDRSTYVIETIKTEEESFMRTLDWTRLRPAQDMLVTQPGDENYKHFVSVVSTGERDVIIVYVPAPMTVEFTNPRGYSYTGQCFDPSTGKYTPATISVKDNCLMIDSPGPEDMVLLLKREMR